MATVIVEYRFLEPTTDAQQEASARDLDPALARRGASWQRSYLSSDRLRMVCEMSARDASSVGEAHREASVPYEAIWESQRWTAEEMNEERAHEQIVPTEAAPP